MWAVEFIEQAEALGLELSPSDSEQVRAVQLLVGRVSMHWCVKCCAFRSGAECRVCRARRTLEEYEEGTARLAAGHEELLPHQRDHTAPRRLKLWRLSDPASEDLVALLEEAAELRRLALAYDRAKKERRALRRRLEDGRNV